MLAASAVALVLLTAAPKSDLDGARLEKLTGAVGAAGADGSFRVVLPRSELDVYAGQVRITPPMGLAAWAAFKKADKGVLVVGELALLEDQLEAAESAAVVAGLEVSALDHHYLGESPRMIFLRFTGQGEEATMGMAVGKAFDAVRAKATSSGPQLATLETSHKPLDAAHLEGSLAGGKVVDGVYTVMRAKPTKIRGVAAGAELGAASWVAIGGADDAAAITGAIAVQDAELQGVLKAARAQNLVVTSIDTPFVGDAPHLRMVHVWGTGPAERLAKAGQAVLASAK